MFFRLHTDGTAEPAGLQSLFAGPMSTACWLIGGGPSLAGLPTDEIARSPLPKLAVNLAGHGLLRPTFWTSYDPTARFHRSIYLDASILKFVHRCRAMDLIPGTTFKVCEAPATLFFERDPQRGYHDFLRSSPITLPAIDRPQPAITDWQDSFVQAIEIAWQLGFRTLYLAGCDMFVRPSPEQLALAETVGVEYRPREPLRDFFDRCRHAGLNPARLESVPHGGQYHFDEQKPLAAAIQTDLHYYRVVQYLRLARRSMALAGLELVCVTPDSRLNDHVAYRDATEVLDQIAETVGDPRRETTRGRYTGTAAAPVAAAPMKDLPPHNWKRGSATPPPAAAPRAPARSPEMLRRRAQLREQLRAPEEIEVPLPENG